MAYGVLLRQLQAVASSSDPRRLYQLGYPGALEPGAGIEPALNRLNRQLQLQLQLLPPSGTRPPGI